MREREKKNSDTLFLYVALGHAILDSHLRQPSNQPTNKTRKQTLPEKEKEKVESHKTSAY